MKNTNKGLGALITGTIMAGALMGSTTATANEMFNFHDLGSGSELRADLLDASNTGFKSPEAKCGEAKAEAKSDAKPEAKAESKAADHKCGEGKCGEGKCGEAKAESKSADHKCGEGKADVKMEKSDAKSDEKKAVKPN